MAARLTRISPEQGNVLRKASLVLLAVALLLTGGFFLRRMSAITVISVAVAVKVCPPSVSACYMLRVSDAEIVVKGKAFAKAAATDSSGVTKVQVPGPGKYSVSARAYVIKGTELEGSAEAKSHGVNTVELVGELVSDATESAG
jgi:hypothetical protein